MGSKAYVEIKGEAEVRFARFKRRLYLGQMNGLRSADRAHPRPGRRAM
jgi:hypothetical protein